MKQKHDEGFSLIEVLVAIALLGALVVPTCTALVMSHRMNAKADALLKAQLAVSSTVETLMAEGIVAEKITDNADYWVEVSDEENVVDDGEKVIDRFPDVTIEIITEEDTPYYNVTVTDNDELVSVVTFVRAAPPADPPASEEGGGQ